MLNFLYGIPFQFSSGIDPQVIGISVVAILFLIALTMWGRRSQQRSEIFCPYCLSRVPKAEQCRNQACKERLHALYRDNSHAGDPPMLISVVGFSGHGKTVYLASLLHALSNHLPLAWDGFFRRSLDQNAVDNLRHNMTILNDGQLPDSTRLNFPKPSIHQLKQMKHYGTRIIALYDPPGEAFEAGERVEKYASFIAKSKAVLFLISLEDLEKPYGNEMTRLLEVYVLGLTNLQRKRQPQHLIVVFTKADALIDTVFAEKPELIDYLDADEPTLVSNLSAYGQEMRTVSAELRTLLIGDLGATNFVNFAEEQFKSVTYTVVSALGSPPTMKEDGSSELGIAIQPRRVLDPLLWVMEKV